MTAIYSIIHPSLLQGHPTLRKSHPVHHTCWELSLRNRPGPKIGQVRVDRETADVTTIQDSTALSITVATICTLLQGILLCAHYCIQLFESYLRWIVDGGQTRVVGEHVIPDGCHRPE